MGGSQCAAEVRVRVRVEFRQDAVRWLMQGGRLLEADGLLS